MQKPMQLFFKNPGHKALFTNTMRYLVEKIDDDGKMDPEYAAALYILTADTATWKRVRSYVSHSGIDFPTMLEEVDLSHGHQVLVQLAGNLFNEQTSVSPVEFTILDTRNFEVAIQAQMIRYCAPRIEQLIERL
jgi:hypothetical protein